MTHEVLIEKLNDKTAVIGIVGLGYVGLPLMLRFVEVGYKVLGIILMRLRYRNSIRGEVTLSILHLKKLLRL